LEKYRSGLRGMHPDDVEGLRMRAMSRQLKNDSEIRKVSHHVSSLQAPAKPVVTVRNGNVEKGKALYQVCVACHGPTGAGNADLKAPPIAGQYDWYLVSQLRKFKAGIRGTAPGDVTGAQMRPMAMTLPDDAAIQDVVAYINTLPGAQ
jgi:cytochrome c553